MNELYEELETPESERKIYQMAKAKISPRTIR